VCANYFCEGVPFWECGGAVGPDLTGASERKFLYVLDLNPNPSNLEGFGTPASFNGAWTKHRCRAEGFATRPATAGKRTSALAPFVGAQKYY
jgi:hypothetical protein